MTERMFVGEVRPSQLMYTYGVGSIVDLPNLSVIVMGLDDWPNNTAVLTESRLLEAVRFHRHSVEELRVLPQAEGEPDSPFAANALYGVPVAVFPRWWVCPMCQLLAPLNAGLFELEKRPFSPERTVYRHTGCTESRRPPEVVPARILVACEDGHLDDFPWVDFVHRGESCKYDKPQLRLREYGTSGEARDLEVRCSCGASRRLAEAFGKDNREHMPLCTSRRPQLRDYDSTPCQHHARPVVLGATNLWFPINMTVLSIPAGSNQLTQLVEQQWATLRVVKTVEILTALRTLGQIQGKLAEYDDTEIIEAIQAYEDRNSVSQNKPAPDLKYPEWEVLQTADPSLNGPDFGTRRVKLGKQWNDLHIEDVLLVERLREVQATIGFARLDAVGELTDPEQQISVKSAPISRVPPKWLPATELRGEGLFFRFNENSVSHWEHSAVLKEHKESFFLAHKRWREKRGIPDPLNYFPGMRYVLLHSFSHALMRQFALEAGYSAASLKERIYARSDEATSGPMAGVLIYTAAADSEGTLGGLIGLGEDEQGMHRIVVEALQTMTLCASDPICAERHIDTQGMTIHAAACHACLFAPETSCERGNRYLDRSVLVPTVAVEHKDLAFFGV